MKFLSSLDPKDRRMLLTVLGLVVALLVVVAIFTPGEDPNDNPVPDSYLAGRHGAKAAFILLQQTGYNVQRWTQPLSELAEHSGPDTTLILAEPGSYESADRKAIRAILNKGGRVIATGLRGGILLPANRVDSSDRASFAACEAQPEGLGPIAAPGSIWMVPRATWNTSDPRFRADYACGGQPVVIDYRVGKGTAIWWANSMPLENGSIARGQNLELLLNCVGPARGRQVFWDESLHGTPPTQWDYVSGPVWPLLLFGSLGLALLVILSFSRRSGPIRPLPQAARTTPIEFLDALGGLYRTTGAAATVTQIAWERFRSQAARLTGLTGVSSSAGGSGKSIAQLDAREISAALERRFGAILPIATTMQADLIAAEEACWNDNLKPRRALAIVQSLRRHEETLRAATSHAANPTQPL